MSADDFLDPAAARKAKFRQAATLVKQLDDIELPRLKWWNYDVCHQHHKEGHKEPLVDCQYRQCGGDFFKHQRVTTAFLYLNRSALLASAPGTGKTNSVYGLIALTKQTKELTKAIVVVQTPAVKQWVAEGVRFTRLSIVGITSGMPKAQREKIYAGRGWDVLVVGYHVLQRDLPLIQQTGFNVLVSDDVDPLLDQSNKTHKALVALASQADRVVVSNYSSMHTRIQQLYASMVPIGGKAIWGTLAEFERRYTRRDAETIYVPNHRAKKGEPKSRKIKRMKTVGYQNMAELRAKLNPWMIRYHYSDLSDVRMPEVMTQEVWLDLSPVQRAMYEELQDGVLRILTKSGKESTKRVQAIAAWTHGQQICAGVAALKDGVDREGTSTKMDWFLDRITSEAWADQKVVVFAKNIGTISALQERLTKVGIGYATVWGQENRADVRAEEVRRFWEDPQCRVFLGTSSIERSLNLQCAGIVVSIDLMLNPERVKQLLGRIRRAGSTFERVYVFTLLSRDTQEERYIDVLRRREALSSAVWEDGETLFEALSPEEMLALIRP